ncbi:MAG: hydrogenase maturation protease [Verrucomicrobia bacterium]|nr:hydrogenase maturation protease [Verrucomicrobiota bacterium]MBV8482370.1 hydrogenase maturation protease [Verrucomicrobiota bacterium]
MKSNGTNLLIIGYGNPLRGDDGIGWRVADQLAALAGDAATVLTVHQLTPELAEPISKAELVIFIDACYGGQPGSWTCETISLDQESSEAFTHYFTPANLLGHASTIFGAKPKALLISVAGASFDCGDHLSVDVAAIIPEIVANVSQWWAANSEKSHA